MRPFGHNHLAASILLLLFLTVNCDPPDDETFRVWVEAPNVESTTFLSQPNVLTFDSIEADFHDEVVSANFGNGLTGEFDQLEVDNSDSECMCVMKLNKINVESVE